MRDDDTSCTPSTPRRENRESAAKLDAHLATPHLVHFASIAGDLLEENGLTITRLQRIA